MLDKRTEMCNHVSHLAENDMYTYRIMDSKGQFLMNVEADNMLKAEDAYYMATGWVRVIYAYKVEV